MKICIQISTAPWAIFRVWKWLYLVLWVSLAVNRYGSQNATLQGKSCPFLPRSFSAVFKHVICCHNKICFTKQQQLCLSTAAALCLESFSAYTKVICLFLCTQSLVSLCAWGMSSCLSRCHRSPEKYILIYHQVWYGGLLCRTAHLLRDEGI